MQFMVSKDRIHDLLNEVLTEKDAFLVNLSVSQGNKIKILVDKNEGLSIDDCVQISRHVEHNLDRDEEDFELEVSSPGLSEPLRVKQQYHKNVGRNVEVLKNDGIKHKGKLTEVTDENIRIEETKKVKKEGSKKKKMVTELVQIPFDDIKSTKILVSFK